MKAAQHQPMEVVKHLPDDLYTGIGMVVAQFSYLEWILNRIVYDLKGFKTTDGRQETFCRQARERVKLVFQLVDEKDLTVTIDREALQRHVSEYESKRDLLSHAIFVRDAEGTLMVRDASEALSGSRPVAAE